MLTWSANVPKGAMAPYQVQGPGAGLASDGVVAGDLEDEDGVRTRRPLVAVGRRHHPVLLGHLEDPLDGVATGHVLHLQTEVNPGSSRIKGNKAQLVTARAGTTCVQGLSERKVVEGTSLD